MNKFKMLPQWVIQLVLQRLANLYYDAPAVQWLDNWASALTTALDQNPKSAGAGLVMAFFSESECQWCQKLSQNVFDSIDFRRWFFHHGFVPLRADPTTIPDSVTLSGPVTGYPTVIAIQVVGMCQAGSQMCTEKGSEIGRVVGYYYPPSSWIALFSQAAGIS